MSRCERSGVQTHVVGQQPARCQRQQRRGGVQGGQVDVAAGAGTAPELHRHFFIATRQRGVFLAYHPSQALGGAIGAMLTTLRVRGTECLP